MLIITIEYNIIAA